MLVHHLQSTTAATAERADPRVAEAFALAVLLTSALQPARTVARTLAA